MSAVSLRLPNSLHQSIKQLALQEHVSVNQLITLAVAEKVSVLAAEDYLSKRGERVDRDRFLKILSKARNSEPDPRDVRSSKRPAR
jgi:hypothetical protein